MKKLSYILCALLMAASTGIFSSCGDNEDFWGRHNLTDDEIAEMERQQRIKDSLRSVINADLILNYETEFYLSANSYDGGEVEIDMDQIASLFGISKDEVGAALNGEGGADVKGFAIEGSTHADNMTSSNTNAFWGHWWDANGDVKDYGEESMVFAEFWYEDGKGIFNVGQFPGHLTAGQSVEFIEAIKYQDKRVAVVIKATGVERGEVKAEIVATNELTLETEQDNNYAQAIVPGFEADAALAALGAGSWADVNWVAVNADGSYAQEYSADPPGFWYDKEGFAGSWGDNASVFTYFNAENGTIGVGQMPNAMEAGSTVTVSFGALYNNKIVMNKITVIITEKGEVGGEVVATNDLTLNTTPNNDYVPSAVPGFDAAATLALLGASDWSEVKWTTELADGSYAQDYNADAPGFWYGKDGYLGAWGEDASVWAHFDGENIVIGQMPEQMPAGSEVTVNFIAVANGKMVRFNIHVVISAYEDPETAPEGTPESITKDITLTSTYNTEWEGSDPVDVKEDLRQAFKMTTYQIYSAIKSGDLKMWIDEVGSPADEAGNPAYTGEAPGYWLDMDGHAASWGSGSEFYYVFLGCSETELYFYGCNHPELFPAEGGTAKVKYILECNGVTATYNVTFNINAQ